METIQIQNLSINELSTLIKLSTRTAIVDIVSELLENQSAKKEEIYGTRKEVAKVLRISLPTLNSLTYRHGILKGYRLKGRVLYKWNEIDKALEAIEGKTYLRGNQKINSNK